MILVKILEGKWYDGLPEDVLLPTASSFCGLMTCQVSYMTVTVPEGIYGTGYQLGS